MVEIAFFSWFVAVARVTGGEKGVDFAGEGVERGGGHRGDLGFVVVLGMAGRAWKSCRRGVRSGARACT